MKILGKKHFRNVYKTPTTSALITIALNPDFHFYVEFISF